MWIVAYTLREDAPHYQDGLASDWTVHETKQEALDEYRRLLDQDNLYAAAVCAIYQSTEWYRTPLSDLEATTRRLAELTAELPTTLMLFSEGEPV
jgi:hypothetical protein